MPPVLIARGISKTYGGRAGPLAVLRDVSLQLSPGEAAVITGPSGSGKSTLLSILGTLEPPSAGTVEIGGVDVATLDERRLAEFRNRSIGFVFQDHHLLPQLTAIENVLLPTLADKSAASARRGRGLLEQVGLLARADHFPAELSGGERQRVALARALVNRPRLLLADEPTGNLDARTAEEIGGLLAQVYARDGAALLLVTHSEALAQRIERRLVLRDGELIGDPSAPQPNEAGAALPGGAQT